LKSNRSLVVEAGLDPDRMPSHVAIIMDGNGRWAKKRLMNRVKGHEQGADVVRKIVRVSSDLGISVLTLYAFSTENWERPKMEVSALMFILKNFLKTELPEMLDKNIRFGAIGQTDRLPDDVRKQMDIAREATRHNTGMILNLALSYGGRTELVDMVKAVASDVRDGILAPDAITEDIVAQRLYTAGLPDPDLMIRTSGEQRISNFLLWQLAYAEFFFTETLWPDFSGEELVRILKAYQERDRRFGKVSKP